MRRLGKPLRLTSQKHILLRANFTPKIGSWVYTKDKTTVGKIIDVFGPVQNPFISVKPLQIKEASKFLPEELFSFEVSRSKNKKTRKKGSHFYGR